MYKIREYGFIAGILTLTLLTSTGAVAETEAGVCAINPRSDDKPSANVKCSVVQEYGYITIRREDGVKHKLWPAGYKGGLYIDETGTSVQGSRKPDGGGYVFRFLEEEVDVTLHR